MMTSERQEESAIGYKVVNLGDVRFGSLAVIRSRQILLVLMAAFGHKRKFVGSLGQATAYQNNGADITNRQ